jgi:hypothetical protein
MENALGSFANEAKVSQLHYPKSRWQYFLLFQSWSQFESWVVLVVLATLLLSSLPFLFNLEYIPIQYILIGAALGSLFSVMMVFSAEFTVSPSNQETLKFISEQLASLSYIETSSIGNSVTYRQNLPRYLRWDEGGITVIFEFDSIKISGAAVILSIVRKRLLKK